MRDLKQKEQGFTLLGVLMVLIIFSVLGFSIIAIASSSVKLSDHERKNQAVYYIAEAGVKFEMKEIEKAIDDACKETNDEVSFFNGLNSKILTDSSVSFKENHGKETKAEITVEELNTGNPRDYKIASVGIIRNSKRKVSTVISINWSKEENNKIVDDILFYSKKFSFHGNSVNAMSGTIIMDGIETHNLNGGSSLNITNMYFNGPVKIDGGSASFGSEKKPGVIYVNGNLDFWNGSRNVYGDIRVNGNFRLKDAKMHGDVYVNGDLELGWTPAIKKNIYYTGKLIAPSSYDESLLRKVIKVEKVDNFKVPTVEFALKEDSWYRSNGYKIKGNETRTLAHNAKILVDDYVNTKWQDVTGHIVIVSKGDIILRGGNGFTGALIAPNGKVEYSGDGTFNGVIISGNQISLPAGGNNFNFKSLNDIFGNDLPLIVNSDLGGGKNESGSAEKQVDVIVKSSIKEE